MKMKFIVTGLLIFSFGRGLSQDTLKCWSSTDKLKWSDFKGKVPSAGLSSSDKAACSSMPKPYPLQENDSTYSYKVKAMFYRYKSWAKAKDTTQYLLAHEQLHFDISELYARIMRKAFKGLGSWTESTANTYSVIKKKIYADHIARQNDYDIKTAHGTIKKAQQEWTVKIHAELEALKEFSSTPEDCDQKYKP